jgi:hypothetical protein
VLPDCREVPPAGDEPNILAGLRQATAEVSADRAGAEDRYSQARTIERDVM